MAQQRKSLSERKIPTSYALKLKTVEKISDMATDMNTSSSEIVEKGMEDKIMDYREYMAKVGEWIKEQKSKGKPICRSCAIRDFHTGNTQTKEHYTKICGEPVRTSPNYTKMIKSDQLGIPMTKKVLDGMQADYECEEGHKIGMNFDMDEWNLVQNGEKVGKAKR